MRTYLVPIIFVSLMTAPVQANKKPQIAKADEYKRVDCLNLCKSETSLMTRCLTDHRETLYFLEIILRRNLFFTRAVSMNFCRAAVEESLRKFDEKLIKYQCEQDGDAGSIVVSEKRYNIECGQNSHAPWCDAENKKLIQPYFVGAECPP